MDRWVGEELSVFSLRHLFGNARNPRYNEQLTGFPPTALSLHLPALHLCSLSKTGTPRPQEMSDDREEV